MNFGDLETGLKELRRDYIDLYQCHFLPNDEEYQQVISPGGDFQSTQVLGMREMSGAMSLPAPHTGPDQGKPCRDG